MHPLVQLARKSIEEYLTTGRLMVPPADLTEEMAASAGVFVSLKKHGDLRGCIGTFKPCFENVAVETIRNAVAAATQDPRFSPVTASELQDLSCSVDVLSPPERIASSAELDPREFGVIVVSGHRKGLLLPDLEGVDTPEDQIRIARMKAGIMPDENIELFRFRVQRYR